MSRYGHIAIFQQSYILTTEIFKMVNNFRRVDKYTLGERLKNICFEILDLIIVANAAKEKGDALEHLGLKLESLRLHLRLAFDLKIIGVGKFGELNQKLEEIGKQLGGWQRWAKR